MSDISALERRISTALDRIRTGVDAMSVASVAAATAPADSSDVEALRSKLEEERTANAQLEERVKVLKDRQDGKISGLESQVKSQSARIVEMDSELQRLRASNADMREINAQLRSAAEGGVGEAELINRAMMAEVEALNAQRSADAAEIDMILSELKPLLKEG